MKRGENKWVAKIFWAFAFAFFVHSSVLPQQVLKVSPAGTSYFVYTPPVYDATQQWPLLIVLHGQGTIGDDPGILLKHRDELPSKLIAQKRWPTRLPFIVVTPQMERDERVADPRDQLWPPALVDEVVESVAGEYAVDRNRIYITGLSLGGHGSYSYAATYPQKIAAMAMISGVPDTTIACQIKDIPLWIFHGSDDGLVKPVFPRGLVRSLEACSPRGRYHPRLTLLPGRRHEGWNEVYNNSSGFNVYDWLLMFTKNGQANVAPHARAGKDIIVSESDAVRLYAEVFDADGTIPMITWGQVGGPPATIADAHSRIPTITGLATGVYEFELKATDNDGATATDRVTVSVVPNANLAVTEIVLVDATTGKDITVLEGDYILNPNNTTKINLRASVTGGTASVQFKVNGHDNARTADQAPFLLAYPEWTVEVGEYLVCATPFAGAGASGTEGRSLCHRITVSDKVVSPPPAEPPVEESPRKFYARTGTDISKLTSWSHVADGSGLAPTSFTADGQTFEITTAAALDHPLAIGGKESVLRVSAGGELHLNSSLEAAVILGDLSKLHVNNGHVPSFNAVAASSAIYFEAEAGTIPAGDYGHVYINGAGTTKKLAAGTIGIEGDLAIEDGVVIEGAENAGSTIRVTGDVLMPGGMTPENKFTMLFAGENVQRFESGSLAVHGLYVGRGSTVKLYGDGGTLITGSVAGGGISVASGATLSFDRQDIVIAEQGALNGAGEDGRIGFTKSTLAISAQNAMQSSLYPLAGQDSLRLLSVNLMATGSLAIHAPLYITEAVRVQNGIIASDGHLTFASTGKRMARLARGAGKVTGEVICQLPVPEGEHTRLLSFPLRGAALTALQASRPDARIATYDTDDGAWKSADEELSFTPGKGYAVTTNAGSDQPMTFSGSVHHGSLEFPLSPNAGNDPDRGWNLIGNPYLSPLRWHPDSMQRREVGAAAYILDHRYPGGRFLVWDGVTGDPEFSGLLSQGQGFFVRTTGASPLLRVTEEMTSDTTALLSRTMQPEGGLALEITLRQSDLIDRAFVRSSAGAQDGFDESDAVKRRNGYFSLATLSEDSVPLAINHIGQSLCDGEIALALYGTSPGQYVLSFQGTLADAAAGAILSDRYTETTHELKVGFEYLFDVTTDSSSFGASRFRIMLPSGSIAVPHVAVEGNRLTSDMASGNQWLLDGVEIAGATGRAYVAEESGEYSVKVSLNGCTVFSAPVRVDIEITGIGENSQPLGVYPNPATDVLYVRVNDSGTNWAYSVMDARGSLVCSGVSTSEQGEININVSTFAPGLYFLRLSRPGSAAVYSRINIRP